MTMGKRAKQMYKKFKPKKQKYPNHFFACPKCDWKISKIAMEQAKLDFFCPRCKAVRISSFIIKVDICSETT